MSSQDGNISTPGADRNSHDANFPANTGAGGAPDRTGNAPGAGSAASTGADGGAATGPYAEGLTKAQALDKYERLLKMSKRSTRETPHYKMLMAAARKTLEVFAISKPPRSRRTSASASDMPDATEVCGLLSDQLLDASQVFNEAYFRAEIFPVRVLKSIGDYY